MVCFSTYVLVIPGRLSRNVLGETSSLQNFARIRMTLYEVPSIKKFVIIYWHDSINNHIYIVTRNHAPVYNIYYIYVSNVLVWLINFTAFSSSIITKCIQTRYNDNLDSEWLGLTCSKYRQKYNWFFCCVYRFQCLKFHFHYWYQTL